MATSHIIPVARQAPTMRINQQFGCFCASSIVFTPTARGVRHAGWQPNRARSRVNRCAAALGGSPRVRCRGAPSTHLLFWLSADGLEHLDVPGYVCEQARLRPVLIL